MFPKPDLRVFSAMALANTLTVLGIFLKVEFSCNRNWFALLKIKLLLYAACTYVHGCFMKGTNPNYYMY